MQARPGAAVAGSPYAFQCQWPQGAGNDVRVVGPEDWAVLLLPVEQHSVLSMVSVFGAPILPLRDNLLPEGCPMLRTAITNATGAYLKDK